MPKRKLPNRMAMSQEDLMSEFLEVLKSKRVLEQLRLECIADVKTKPTYIQLKERIKNYVTNRMPSDEWASDDTFREQVVECGVMALTVERVVDAVVARKLEECVQPMLEQMIQEYIEFRTPSRHSHSQPSSSKATADHGLKETQQLVRTICDDTKRDSKKIMERGLVARSLDQNGNWPFGEQNANMARKEEQKASANKIHPQKKRISHFNNPSSDDSHNLFPHSSSTKGSVKQAVVKKVPVKRPKKIATKSISPKPKTVRPATNWESSDDVLMAKKTRVLKEFKIPKKERSEKEEKHKQTETPTYTIKKCTVSVKNLSQKEQQTLIRDVANLPFQNKNCALYIPVVSPSVVVLDDDQVSHDQNQPAEFTSNSQDSHDAAMTDPPVQSVNPISNQSFISENGNTDDDDIMIIESVAPIPIPIVGLDDDDEDVICLGTVMSRRQQRQSLAEARSHIETPSVSSAPLPDRTTEPEVDLLRQTLDQLFQEHTRNGQVDMKLFREKLRVLQQHRQILKKEGVSSGSNNTREAASTGGHSANVARQPTLPSPVCQVCWEPTTSTCSSCLEKCCYNNYCVERHERSCRRNEKKTTRG